MVRALLFPALLAATLAGAADQGAREIHPPYGAQKIVFDFYFDEPEKINAALYWIRSVINPLGEAPYSLSPDELSLKVVIHGAEIVTVARRNEARYQDAVERMRYYAELGVEFKVCALAAEDYGYRHEDLQDFVELVPSAMLELAHWQLQGHALLAPNIQSKRYSIEEIR